MAGRAEQTAGRAGRADEAAGRTGGAAGWAGGRSERADEWDGRPGRVNGAADRLGGAGGAPPPPGCKKSAMFSAPAPGGRVQRYKRSNPMAVTPRIACPSEVFGKFRSQMIPQ
eukprot:gene8941-biopygen3178